MNQKAISYFSRSGLTAATLVAALMCAPAYASNEEQQSFFNLEQMPALLDVFASPEKALSPDHAATLQVWNKFLTENHIRVFSGPNHCGGVDTAADFQSAMGFNLWLVAASNCPDENSTVSVDLKLKNADEAKAARHLVEQRFGPSDPKCTNEKTAFWGLRPGYSLRWSSLYGKMPSITLIANDAPDANCTISSVKGAPLVDQAQVDALFARIKNEPPPWNDSAVMAKWLSTYGKDIKQIKSPNDQCRQTFFMPSTQTTLSGAPYISAEANELGCKADDPFKFPPKITLMTTGTDMFAEGKLRKALTKTFGEPIPACHDDIRDIWKVSDDTIAAIAIMGEQVAFAIYAMPLEAHECGKK